MNYPEALRLKKEYDEVSAKYREDRDRIYEKYKDKSCLEFRAAIDEHDTAWRTFIHKNTWARAEAGKITEEEKEAFLAEYMVLVKRHKMTLTDCGDYCTDGPCIVIALVDDL